MNTDIKSPPAQLGIARDFGVSPSQTVGPFFAYGLTAEQYGYAFTQRFDHRIAQPHAAGEHIVIEGVVQDGDGAAVTDAIVEFIQLDSTGNFPSSSQAARASGFNGFGRVGTGTDLGSLQGFRFETVKPAALGQNAPCIHVVLTMRGLLTHLFTRLYFSDEAAANAQDPALALVPQARRATLMAQRKDGACYEFIIRLQAADPTQETVFFDT